MPEPTPIAALKAQTQTSFVTLNLITQACEGLVNTTFTCPPQKPSWFDELNHKLDGAKINARTWKDELAPNVAAGVPLQVVDYQTTYSALTNTIMGIVHAYPDAKGAEDPHVQQVHALVAELQTSVNEKIRNADATATKLTTWGDAMQTSHDELSSGAASIQQAEVSLSTDVEKMNGALEALKSEIHQENIAIAASAAGIGAGLLMLVVGIALAPETGGYSLIVAGTGGVLIVGGAVVWGVMQAKINAQFKEVAADQEELEADKRQLVALKGLSTASSQAIEYTTDAGRALSEFRTTWALFEGELKGVSEKLQHAEDSLSTVVEGAFTEAAAKEWEDAANLAQALADAPVSAPSKEVPMNSETAVQAA
jgi:hypothetical protein